MIQKFLSDIFHSWIRRTVVYVMLRNILTNIRFAVRQRMGARPLVESVFVSVTANGFRKRKRNAENGRVGTTLGKAKRLLRRVRSVGKKETPSSEPLISWLVMPSVTAIFKSLITVQFAGRLTYNYTAIMTTMQNLLRSGGFAKTVTINGIKNMAQD